MSNRSRCVESLSLRRRANFQRRRRTLCGFRVCRIRSRCGLRTFSLFSAGVPALARPASCELATVTTPAWLSAVGGAGAWSVLRRPENSVRNRRPCRGFRWVAVARGASSEFRSRSTTLSGFSAGGGRRASSEFCSQSTTLLWFSAGGGAGAWSVLRILLAIDDPLTVLGGWRRWRVERPRNNGWSSRGFGRAAAPARGVFINRGTNLVPESTFP